MRIGIDLGGTKIEGIAIADTGEERARRRIAAPRGDYGNTLSAVSGLVAGIERDVATRCSVGIGIPGTVSPATGLIKNSNSTWLNGQALADDLSRLLDRPIRFANDANCFALSEATDGAAAGARDRVRRHRRHGNRRWSRHRWPGAHRRQRDRRRVGTQSAPRRARRRVARSAVLLRPERLHRDLPVWTGARARPRRRRRRAHRRRRRLRRGLPQATRWRMPRWPGTRIGWRERSPASSTSSIPTSSCWAADCRTSIACTSACRALWLPHIFSDRVVTRLERAKHGDSSGVRGAAWLWERERR